MSWFRSDEEGTYFCAIFKFQASSSASSTRERSLCNHRSKSSVIHHWQMVSYQPTPVEQAYAVYLSQTIFGTTPQNFRVPGRMAVPFLSQSGIDRMILRDIWNLVDPTQVGELQSITQLYVVCRLVALAQYGPLIGNLQQNPSLSPTIVMTSTLKQTCQVQLNLPVFTLLPFISLFCD